MKNSTKPKRRTIKNSPVGEFDLETLDPTRLKWEEFIDRWIQSSFNATEAYVQVFKCTRKSASARAIQLLGNARFKELAQEVLRAKYGMTEENVKNWSLQARDNERFSPEVRTRNNELLARIMGLFLDDKGQQQAVQVNVIFKKTDNM